MIDDVHKKVNNVRIDRDHGKSTLHTVRDWNISIFFPITRLIDFDSFGIEVSNVGLFSLKVFTLAVCKSYLSEARFQRSLFAIIANKRNQKAGGEHCRKKPQIAVYILQFYASI
jgi:hypothetical protein